MATPSVKAATLRFFKTGAGQSSEGDCFIGVRVPDLRKLSREYRQLPLAETAQLLQSKVHEHRLLALLILLQQVTHSDSATCRTIYDFYMRHIKHVNNWDLVDTSAPTIVGGYLYDRSRQPLRRLAKSTSLWERRIAILATLFFIRQHDFEDTLSISHSLLGDREDLIHKATGWMLREVGNRNVVRLRQFLDQHANSMPRTMLRYAIEKLPADERKAYLGTR